VSLLTRHLGVKFTPVDRRATILVADDDATVLKQAANALEDAGFRVVKVGDGQVALQEALSRKVDLIVMDISMPHLGGVEACHCLKAMPKTQKIPIILMAAKKDPASRALAERTHGCVSVLKKPFTDENLVSVARKVVRPKSLI